MADHILLTTIYDVINDLVKPQNEGRGAYATIEKPISSLRELSDGKRLAKMLREECSTSAKAKKSLTDATYSYFDARGIYFTTEQIEKIINNWTDEEMLNFVVVFMKSIVEWKGRTLYRRTTLERLRSQFDCIDSYFERAYDNCLNIINGQIFNSLIDQKFFETTGDSFDSSEESDLMTEDESSTETRIDYDALFDHVINEMSVDLVPPMFEQPMSEFVDLPTGSEAMSVVEQNPVQSRTDSKHTPAKQTKRWNDINHLEDGRYQCGHCKKTLDSYRAIVAHSVGQRKKIRNHVTFNSKKQQNKKGILCVIQCDRCNKQIKGIRYKCTVCQDFDLCSKCEKIGGVHNVQHSFEKMKKWVKRFYLPKIEKKVSVNINLQTGSAETMAVMEQRPAIPQTDLANTSTGSETMAVIEQKPAIPRTDLANTSNGSETMAIVEQKPVLSGTDIIYTPLTVSAETQTVIAKKAAAIQTFNDTKPDFSISQTQTDVKPHITTATQTQAALPLSHTTQTEDTDCEIIFETSPNSSETLNKKKENALLVPIKREPPLEDERNTSVAMVCNDETNNRDTNGDNIVNENRAQETLSDLVTESYQKLSESQQNLIVNQEFLLGIQRGQLNEYERRERTYLQRIQQLESVVFSAIDNDIEHSAI